MPRSASLRAEPADLLAFFRGFLHRPHQVGSVIPSSRFLKRRLVEAAEVTRAQVVVELGPGTGGTTRALLAALPSDARLLCIEINPRFAALLGREHDPRLIVHHGSAEDLRRLLAHYRLAAPDAIVSGIPFSTMPPARGRRIIENIRRALAPGGRFVAYQVRSRVADLARPILGAPDITIVLRNLPPARLFSWRMVESRRRRSGARARRGSQAAVARGR